MDSDGGVFVFIGGNELDDIIELTDSDIVVNNFEVVVDNDGDGQGFVMEDSEPSVEQKAFAVFKMNAAVIKDRGIEILGSNGVDSSNVKVGIVNFSSFQGKSEDFLRAEFKNTLNNSAGLNLVLSQLSESLSNALSKSSSHMLARSET